METSSSSPVAEPPRETPPPSVVIKPRSGRRTLLTVLLVILGCCGVTAAGTVWWVKRNFYASPIRPVSLSQTEQQALQAKLEALHLDPAAPSRPVLTPEEQRRSITVTQKEINAYLAQQGLGDTVKVELGNDSISAMTIVPIPPDAPLFGGTTLRLRLALGVRMAENKKMTVQVNDISVGGVPLPNAWLGDIKGVNLADERFESDPALQRFFDGIKTLEVRNGELLVVLNE